MNFKQALSPEELAAVLTPHLRLFLSVDVVGSTKFKHTRPEQAEPDGAKPWLKFIHGFYTGFPDMFIARVGEAKAHTPPGTELPTPYLWKALGDELIFCVVLSHHANARLYLKAFRDSLMDAIKNWSGGDHRLPVSFNGTAWLAGFPVFNSAIPLNSPNPLTTESREFDFVGPLLDVGFRLAKFASPRKFVVSADLVWLITQSGDTAQLDFYYDGSKFLKGVLNQSPYPIFWIDCPFETIEANSFQGIENRLLGRDACTPKVICELAQKFLDSVPDSIPKPFFFDQPNTPDHLRPPLGFAERLHVAQAEMRRIYFPPSGDISGSPGRETSRASDAEVEALLERVHIPKRRRRKKGGK